MHYVFFRVEWEEEEEEEELLLVVALLVKGVVEGVGVSTSGRKCYITPAFSGIPK